MGVSDSLGGINVAVKGTYVFYEGVFCLSIADKPDVLVASVVVVVVGVVVVAHGVVEL